jgi:5-methyltetrahydropteroyltriglutamate--homocysteine methyltransferase
VRERTAPPFRVDHVGSFPRPKSVTDAAHRLRAGEVTPEQFRSVQDEAIRGIVAFQEELGLGSITDGEYRRRVWSGGFIDAVPAFGERTGALSTFRTESSAEIMSAPAPYARERLQRTRGIATDEFGFLKSAVRSGTPKVTMPSPPVMHFFLGPRAVDETVYPDIEVFFEDLARVYREEIAALADLGCTYLQLDDTALPCNCDERLRQAVRERGEDPDGLTGRYAQLINSAIASRPEGMTIAMHLCRGNARGAWMAEGGYEPIAETLFNTIQVDAYFLEYDTPRAGDFGPLRFVPPGKTVVLGLVSTKTPVLESEDEVLRRIEQAARVVPLERLCLSPQCGFASVGGAQQVVTLDDARRKIELMQRVADRAFV